LEKVYVISDYRYAQSEAHPVQIKQKMDYDSKNYHRKKASNVASNLDEPTQS